MKPADFIFHVLHQSVARHARHALVRVSAALKPAKSERCKI
jgi:hypothetical protein